MEDNLTPHDRELLERAISAPPTRKLLDEVTDAKVRMVQMENYEAACVFRDAAQRVLDAISSSPRKD